VCSMMASSLLIIEKDLGAAPLPWFTRVIFVILHHAYAMTKQHHSPIQIYTIRCRTFDPPLPPVFSCCWALVAGVRSHFPGFPKPWFETCPSHPCAWIMCQCKAETIVEFNMRIYHVHVCR
jgi:hypothetical protein